MIAEHEHVPKFVTGEARTTLYIRNIGKFVELTLLGVNLLSTSLVSFLSRKLMSTIPKGPQEGNRIVERWCRIIGNVNLIGSRVLTLLKSR